LSYVSGGRTGSHNRLKAQAANGIVSALQNNRSDCSDTKMSKFESYTMRKIMERSANMAIGGAIVDHQKRIKEIEETQGREAANEAANGTVGMVAGAASGAVAGATIGSAVPVLGTAVGGTVGMVVGAVKGSQNKTFAQNVSTYLGIFKDRS
jgi:phage tail tape-measure protein